MSFPVIQKRNLDYQALPFSKSKSDTSLMHLNLIWSYKNCWLIDNFSDTRTISHLSLHILFTYTLHIYKTDTLRFPVRMIIFSPLPGPFFNRIQIHYNLATPQCPHYDNLQKSLLFCSTLIRWAYRVSMILNFTQWKS